MLTHSPLRSLEQLRYSVHRLRCVQAISANGLAYLLVCLRPDKQANRDECSLRAGDTLATRRCHKGTSLYTPYDYLLG